MAEYFSTNRPMELPDVEPEPPLEELTGLVGTIDPDCVSSNGNAYTKIKVDGRTVFVWKNHWRTHLDRFRRYYLNETARVFVRDKSDDGDDRPFLCLQAITPTDRKAAGEIFSEIQMIAGIEPLSDEQIRESKEAVADTYGGQKTL